MGGSLGFIFIVVMIVISIISNMNEKNKKKTARKARQDNAPQPQGTTRERLDALAAQRRAELQRARGQASASAPNRVSPGQASWSNPSQGAQPFGRSSPAPSSGQSTGGMTMAQRIELARRQAQARQGQQTQQTQPSRSATRTTPQRSMPAQSTQRSSQASRQPTRSSGQPNQQQLRNARRIAAERARQQGSTQQRQQEQLEALRRQRAQREPATRDQPRNVTAATSPIGVPVSEALDTTTAMPSVTRDLRRKLTGKPQAIREAYMLSEILAAPKSLRETQGVYANAIGG